MAQIFHPGFNTLARLGVLLAVTGPVAVIMGASAISRSSFNTKVGVAPDQPIPFSHEHHVNELGIDCRYCHTSVEKAAHSNVPASETCMSCHSQIWTNSPLLDPMRESYRTNTPVKWNLINKVPEFVYFNHSIHINRGLNCNTCHGPIQKMQMTYKGQYFHMVWCLECHRNPEKFVGKREDVFSLYERGQRTSANNYVGRGVTRRETELLRHGGLVPREGKELEEGKALVKQYGIKTKQLTDCSICHR
ncbi:MAG: cytochrome c3 family protein [Chthonomonadaceae bacterium]|nr:cytochrome c3 family protein [Chthonomonadaceae bacterium]